MAGVVVAAQADDPTTPSTPATEQVLLPAPDPQAPTSRGTFISDPHGQIETIAATGHLVAWSVRTPADRLRTSNADIDRASPLELPQHSQVVVVDERGGAPLVVDVGATWVSRLRMLRGAGGDAEPQVVIDACRDRSERRCTAQLLTLTPSAPVRVIARADASNLITAALAGRVDQGRRLILGKHRGHGYAAGKCLPRISITKVDGTDRRTLPPVIYASDKANRCYGLDHVELHGRYAAAYVNSQDPKAFPDATGIDLTTVAVLDVDGGPSAKWRAVQYPYRYSDYASGIELGPATTDSAMYWEELDTDEEVSYSLQLVALPRDVLADPTATTPTTSKPVVLNGSANPCDIAATVDAIYELENDRCSAFGGFGEHRGGTIRRVTSPEFTPEPDG